MNKFAKYIAIGLVLVSQHALAIFDECLDYFPNQITPTTLQKGRALCFDSFAVFYSPETKKPIYTIEKLNQEKADLLYNFLDQSSLYENRVTKEYRSRMNVTFFLKDENLNAEFLAQSNAAGLVALRGHKAAGGMRASIYNAMPIEGVKALVEFMRDFERRA